MQFTQFPIPFVKMSGTGNDFILIDHRRPIFGSSEVAAEFARRVCRRRFSVGADGLILIEDSEQADFRWQFFNGDGSVAEMCGNGARCAARFAYMHGIAPARMRFETLAGIIEASVADTEVAVKMTTPGTADLHTRVDLDGRAMELHCLDTGVPHAVVFTEDLDGVDVHRQGSAIRFHEKFSPAGTNVNFVQVQEDGTIRVRTYERGVEAETMACGTGAVAASLIGALLDLVSSPVRVVTSGGDRLTISFDLQEDGRAENVFLRGPALVIYRGELNGEAVR